MPGARVSKAKGLNHTLENAEPGVEEAFRDVGRKGPRMLSKLDPAWLMMAVGAVVVLSYYLGSALDALMRDDGFGSFGNAIIISGGFFLAIFGANEQGYNLRELHLAIMVGIVGAFLVLTSLALIKALIRRM
jgi:hypothetical protein